MICGAKPAIRHLAAPGNMPSTEARSHLAQLRQLSTVGKFFRKDAQSAINAQAFCLTEGTYEVRLALRNGNAAPVARTQRVQHLLGSARSDRTRRPNRYGLCLGGRASLPRRVLA